MASYTIKVSESEIEKYVCLYAKQQGWLVFKLAKTGIIGAPDRLFLDTAGHCFFVEFKSARGALSKMQELIRGRLQKNHAIYLVINSKEYGKNWINAQVEINLETEEN